MNLILLTHPSTGPLLQGKVIAALKAASSRCNPTAKDLNSAIPEPIQADSVFERYANGRESVILDLNSHLGGCQVYVQNPSGNLTALLAWIRGL